MNDKRPSVTARRVLADWLWEDGMTDAQAIAEAGACLNALDNAGYRVVPKDDGLSPVARFLAFGKGS